MQFASLLGYADTRLRFSCQTVDETNHSHFVLAALSICFLQAQRRLGNVMQKMATTAFAGDWFLRSCFTVCDMRDVPSSRVVRSLRAYDTSSCVRACVSPNRLGTTQSDADIFCGPLAWTLFCPWHGLVLLTTIDLPAGSFVALVANTRFQQVFDDGYSPKELPGAFGASWGTGNHSAGGRGSGVGNEPMREELGCIMYASNVLGSRGPRKMQASVF